MARTTQALATSVLRRLNVIGADETPSANDATLIKEMYADLYQELETEDVAFWPEAAIPEHIFRALVDYIAGNAAPDFGRIEYVGLVADGERRLRRVASEDPTGEPITADYY